MMKTEATPPVRVLLIDDDENVHPFISHLLSKVAGKKFAVTWARDYDEGVAAIRRHDHDVCLLDYKLGGQSGLELLRRAVAEGIQAPIIMLTGAADPVVDLEATELGASDYVLKDRLDASTLERSIRYSIQHYDMLRDLKKSNERFRLLFERSMDAILISDDDGNFLEVNSAACKLLGQSRAELIQRKIDDLLFTESGGALEPLGDQSLGGLSFVPPGGERRYAEFSSARFAPHLNLSILRDITERRALEQEIQEISEREQRRLGEDLHDGLGQMLTGISFITKVLQQKLSAKRLEEAKDAANLVQLMNQALTQTRDLARGLCPTVLDQNDIHAALEHLCNNLEKYFGISTEVKCDAAIQIHENSVAVHLYRIAQEASTNAVKHGQAKKVSLSLLRSNGKLVLQVKDDGIGFPAEVKSTGMGLRVMHHRARMISATVRIEKVPGGGTVVTCVMEQPAPRVEKKAEGRKKNLAVNSGKY